MPQRSSTRWVAAAIPVLILALSLAFAHQHPAEASAAPRAAQAGEAPTSRVLHRVVWADASRGTKGIHLSSANLDGSGLQHIYDASSGFITALTMDRQGGRVAFAPCCAKREPLLVVAAVLGGKAWRPLAAYQSKFYFVGGIGWSPSGRRLVFEAGTSRGTRPNCALWTVGLNGHGLRRILTWAHLTPEPAATTLSRGRAPEFSTPTATACASPGTVPPTCCSGTSARCGSRATASTSSRGTGNAFPAATRSGTATLTAPTSTAFTRGRTTRSPEPLAACST